MTSIAIMSNQHHPPSAHGGSAQITLQSPKQPGLLPSFFPLNSISPAKRERTASVVGGGGGGGQGLEFEVVRRGGGLSPRSVNLPSTTVTTNTINNNTNTNTNANANALRGNTNDGVRFLFKSGKEISKIGGSQQQNKSIISSSSTCSKVGGGGGGGGGGFISKKSGLQPLADVFFIPPAPPAPPPPATNTDVQKSSLQMEVIGNGNKRIGSPSLESLVSRNITKRRRGDVGDDDEVGKPSVGTINQPGLGNTNSKSTTTTIINSNSNNAKQKDEKKENAMNEWRNKYTKAFPNFVFYFDADVSSNLQNRFKEKIKKLGGRFEPFLSNKVTHHITPKAPIPTSTTLSSSKKPLQGDKQLALSQNTNTKQSMQELKIKVWSVDKLSDVLANLLGFPQPSFARLPNRDISLSTLLEDERLHGTRERDASARRADHYYFAAGNGFLLVEDALGEHRPVMVKEYEKARNKDEVPVWPVLHDTFLCPGQTAKANTVPVSELRERAWKQYVEREVEVDRKNDSGNFPSLSRSTSNSTLNMKPEFLLPYQAASGNSVVLTSTIASTSNAHMSGGTPNAFFNGTNGAAAYAQGKDKRLIDMSKRVQVLKGNFMRNGGSASTTPVSISTSSVSKTGVGAASPRPPRAQVAAEIPQVEELDEDMKEDVDEDIDMESPDTLLIEVPEVAEETAGVMNQRVRDRVLQILKRSKTRSKPVYIGPTLQRIIRKCKENGLRLQMLKTQSEIDAAKKPGYCENCRVKYDSFDNHLRSRKHSKFALNDENFEALDYLIQRLARPSGHWDTPAAFSFAHASPPADPETYPLDPDVEALISNMSPKDAWAEVVDYIEEKEASRRDLKRTEAAVAGDEDWELYR